MLFFKTNFYISRANKHRKVNRSKDYVAKEDPEKLKAEAEKLENEKIKAQRKLEAKRRQALEASYYESADFYDEDRAQSYRNGDAQMIRELNEYQPDEFGKKQEIILI